MLNSRLTRKHRVAAILTSTLLLSACGGSQGEVATAPPAPAPEPEPEPEPDAVDEALISAAGSVESLEAGRLVSNQLRSARLVSTHP